MKYLYIVVSLTISVGLSLLATVGLGLSFNPGILAGLIFLALASIALSYKVVMKLYALDKDKAESKNCTS